MRSVLFFALLLCTLPTFGRTLIVAFSPHQATEVTATQAQAILQFLAGLDPGDQATLIDGNTLTTIGQFQVPNSPAYNNPRARLAANRAVVAALLNYAKQSDPDSRVPGAIRWPQLLQAIAQTQAPPAGTDVLLLASPIYDAPADAAFSMAGERYPSDGHLMVGRNESLFGTADSSRLLSGLRIHVVHPDSLDLRNERYRQAVLRFWTHYVTRQGGELVSFTVDLTSALARITQQAPAPHSSFEIEGNNRIEMIRLAPETIGTTTIFERPLSERALTPAQIRQAEQLEIGLSWDCARCDVDLHARPHPGAQVLYYGQIDTPEGRYWKDFMTSPLSTGGFETISFQVPVDLRSLVVVVNHYIGDAPGGIEAELRISTFGQTYARRIRLGAGSGHGSRGVNKVLAGGPSTASTQRIDLSTILSP